MGRIDQWKFPVDPAFWLTLPYRPTPRWIGTRWMSRADDKLLAAVEVEVTGCWTSHRKNSGWNLGRRAYEIVVGPTPPGYFFDRLCGDSTCCNPYHCEPVTADETSTRYIMRGDYLKIGATDDSETT